MAEKGARASWQLERLLSKTGNFQCSSTLATSYTKQHTVDQEECCKKRMEMMQQMDIIPRQHSNIEKSLLTMTPILLLACWSNIPTVRGSELLEQSLFDLPRCSPRVSIKPLSSIEVFPLWNDRVWRDWEWK